MERTRPKPLLLAVFLALAACFDAAEAQDQAPSRVIDQKQEFHQPVATANSPAELIPGQTLQAKSIRLTSQTAPAVPRAESPRPARPAVPEGPAQNPGSRPNQQRSTQAKPATPRQPADSPETSSPASPPSVDLRPADRQLSPFSSLRTPANRQPFLARLTRTPDLFGDTFVPITAFIDLQQTVAPQFVFADLPLGGGTRRFKNEHAKAMPADRVFFFYNHFHNAADLQTDQDSSSEHIDQFTFGFERMSDDGLWSIEMRMPFSTGIDNAATGVDVQASGTGNLVATLKRLLVADENFAAALGLAVVAPTGSDVNITFPNSTRRLEVSNEAVHLLPYAAIQVVPDDRWFFHGFLQVDVAANSNSVLFDDGNAVQTADLSEQTLLYLDASAGYWWFRSDETEGLTGLASVAELHYTTTLNDADRVNLGTAQVENFENRFDVVNFTAGVHTEWNRDTSVRAAVVVPLDRSERFFDSEAQLSVIRTY